MNIIHIMSIKSGFAIWNISVLGIVVFRLWPGFYLLISNPLMLVKNVDHVLLNTSQ